MGEEFRSHHIISSLASNFLSKCYAPILWPQEGLKFRVGLKITKKKEVGSNQAMQTLKPSSTNRSLQENKKDPSLIFIILQDHHSGCDPVMPIVYITLHQCLLILFLNHVALTTTILLLMKGEGTVSA